MKNRAQAAANAAPVKPLSKQNASRFPKRQDGGYRSPHKNDGYRYDSRVTNHKRYASRRTAS